MDVMTLGLAATLLVCGAWAAIHGARRVVAGARDADSLGLIRGIRALCVAVASWALAGGLVLGQTWLFVFGGVFLAEELYETGVVALVLRRGELV